MKAYSVGAVIIMLAACSNPPAPAPPVGPAPVSVAVLPDTRFSALKDELKSIVASGELVSLGIGVVQDGCVVWAEAWGWADREAGIDATVDTRYGVASLGKSITATAIMTLVERRKVRLETNVGRILGNQTLRVYAGDQAPTVRQLLNMTSGIPHGAMTYNSEPYPTEHDILGSRAIVVFEPGSVFHYSNFSIAVADSVIEKISGRTFEDYIRRDVFAPLGMTLSSVGAPISLPAPAVRYDEGGRRFEPFHPLPRSSRQMQASVSDMIKYAAFQLKTPFQGQKRLLSERSIDALHNERSDAPGAHIALAWGSIDIGNGRRWIISSGNDMGLQSSLTLLPDKGVGVIVLTNSSGAQADEIGVRAADILAPGFAAAAVGAMRAHQARSMLYEPTADWIGEWVGAIVSRDREIPVKMSFAASGAIRIVCDGGASQVLEEATLTNGMLTGAFTGNLPLEEDSRRDHRIEIGVHREGDDLSGFALANFRSERGKFELPTYLHLTRKPAT